MPFWVLGARDVPGDAAQNGWSKYERDCTALDVGGEGILVRGVGGRVGAAGEEVRRGREKEDGLLSLLGKRGYRLFRDQWKIIVYFLNVMTGGVKRNFCFSYYF